MWVWGCGVEGGGPTCVARARLGNDSDGQGHGCPLPDCASSTQASGPASAGPRAVIQPGSSPHRPPPRRSPSSAAAYLGDRSWWLQYRPARAQAPSAKAKDMMPTMRAAGPVPGVVGVRKARAIMQTAGPAKEMPCGEQKEIVSRDGETLARAQHAHVGHTCYQRQHA